MTAPQQQKRGGNPYYQIRGIPVRNESTTSTIPAFGLVTSRGTEATTGAMIVDAPTLINGTSVTILTCYANGPTPILPNGYGTVYKSWPLWVAYDTADTPRINQIWGPNVNSGSYLLTANQRGFSIEGDPVNGRVLVAASPVEFSGALYGFGPLTPPNNVTTQITLNPQGTDYANYGANANYFTVPSASFLYRVELTISVSGPTVIGLQVLIAGQVVFFNSVGNGSIIQCSSWVSGAVGYGGPNAGQIVMQVIASTSSGSATLNGIASIIQLH